MNRNVGFLIVAALVAVPLFALEPESVKHIDEVIARHAKSEEPGCAVGIEAGGEVVERAYGMANLEYDIPLRPDSIFEIGSVSKQFTAAAVVLLAREGRLKLDDPIRKYLPELSSAYDAVTIRQMLDHTSGIRDWGALVALTGWPRGTRQDTHAHVLQLLARQRALNFTPGTEYSYSNSNYNLAAMIVERVSGKPFPAFVAERIFQPAEMTHSSVRDDWTRIVKNRATAYDPDGKTFVTDIHFENIYGNCCVLSTVGDLLRWTHQLGSFPELQALVPLTNGATTGYGLGLGVGHARGTLELSHTGATAGWRALLTTFPEKHVSIAVLCNRGDGPLGLAREIGDVLLDPAPAPGKKEWEPKLAGLYRDAHTNAVLRFFVKDGELRMGFSGSGQSVDPDRVQFTGDSVRLTTQTGYDATYRRVEDWKPSPADLEKLAGRYRSDEIDATIELKMRSGSLTQHFDPIDDDDVLEPTFARAFRVGNSELITFTDDGGFDLKADFGMSSGTARLERLHFTRLRWTETTKGSAQPRG